MQPENKSACGYPSSQTGYCLGTDFRALIASGMALLDSVLAGLEGQQRQRAFPGCQDRLQSASRLNRLSMLEPERLHRAVCQALFAASGISEAQAQEWAGDKVFIHEQTRQGLAALKKPYPGEAVRRDLAEFYRLCGGKLVALELAGVGTRSQASAGYMGIINIDSTFNKRTLFHECGHQVEFLDSRVKLAASAFRRNRMARGPRTSTSLRAWSYPQERAPGKGNLGCFFDPYVAKTYPDGYTEVYSMGLQMLATPLTLARIVRADLEHCALVLGACLFTSDRQKSRLKSKEQEYIDRIQASLATTLKKQHRQERLRQWRTKIDKALPPDFLDALLGYENVDGCDLVFSLHTASFASAPELGQFKMPDTRLRCFGAN